MSTTKTTFKAKIINVFKYNDDFYTITYKYWEAGKCACTSKNSDIQLSYRPTTDQLINILNA